MYLRQNSQIYILARDENSFGYDEGNQVSISKPANSIFSRRDRSPWPCVISFSFFCRGGKHMCLSVSNFNSHLCVGMSCVEHSNVSG